MKCVSLHQPWAWAIFDPAAAKDVENRTRATRHRGPLLIHAARSLKSLDAEDPALWRTVYGVELPAREVLTFGAILGVVDVIGCVPVGLNGRVGGRYSVWAQVGLYGWLLANPRAFAEPIPYKGSQQFFEVADELLPDTVRSRG
jgi:hypothetical protein